MNAPGKTSTAAPRPRILRIGCVSYLNAKPLIDGLDDTPEARVRFDVPARMLGDLESAAADLALCPVIDYWRSAVPLVVVPAGAIGCRGSTLTVRLFSRDPIESIRCVAADNDSHTSVTLLRVLMFERYGRRIEIVPHDARRGDAPPAPSVLLIGDKVVTGSPPEDTHPHRMDLGQAWLEATRLPFVFAVWMARAGSDLGDLPRRLDDLRRVNSGRIDAIVERHAAAHGWPVDLARRYLGDILRFDVGPPQVEAIEHFGRLAGDLGLIERTRGVDLYAPPT